MAVPDGRSMARYSANMSLSTPVKWNKLNLSLHAAMGMNYHVGKGSQSLFWALSQAIS